MTIVSELKKIFEKISGHTSVGSTTDEVLSEIAEVVGDGSDLPAVTDEDNGDVLTVVSGKWDKAAPSGGGGALVVHITGENYDTLDKTAAEIWTAMQTGSAIIVFNYEGEGTANPIISAYYYPSESEIVFTIHDYEHGGVVNYSATSADDYPKRDVEDAL